MRGILQFITQTLWKSLFGGAADNLQRSVDSEDEYMIVEKVRVGGHFCCLLTWPKANESCRALARLDSSPSCYRRIAAHLAAVQDPLVNAFISSAPVNCAAFVAGIIRGVLEASRFPAQVTAHDNEEGATVYLIKFDAEVLQREKRQS